MDRVRALEGDTQVRTYATPFPHFFMYEYVLESFAHCRSCFRVSLLSVYFMLQFKGVCQEENRRGAALVLLALSYSYPLFALSENCAFLLKKYILFLQRPSEFPQGQELRTWGVTSGS